MIKYVVLGFSLVRGNSFNAYWFCTRINIQCVNPYAYVWYMSPFLYVFLVIKYTFAVLKDCDDENILQFEIICLLSQECDRLMFGVGGGKCLLYT